MKKGMGIGAILLIGLVIWVVLKKPELIKAAPAYPTTISEYELLPVPITKYEEKEILVFTSIEEYREATYD